MPRIWWRSSRAKSCLNKREDGQTGTEVPKDELQLPVFERVAQVSILRPGYFGPDQICGENPGLKIETWTTHSTFERAIFIRGFFNRVRAVLR
jgi:hypothetical protein